MDSVVSPSACRICPSVIARRDLIDLEGRFIRLLSGRGYCRRLGSLSDLLHRYQVVIFLVRQEDPRCMTALWPNHRFKGFNLQAVLAG